MAQVGKNFLFAKVSLLNLSFSTLTIWFLTAACVDYMWGLDSMQLIWRLLILNWAKKIYLFRIGMYKPRLDQIRHEFLLFLFELWEIII